MESAALIHTMVISRADVGGCNDTMPPDDNPGVLDWVGALVASSGRVWAIVEIRAHFPAVAEPLSFVRDNARCRVRIQPPQYLPRMQSDGFLTFWGSDSFVSCDVPAKRRQVVDGSTTQAIRTALQSVWSRSRFEGFERRMLG